MNDFTLAYDGFVPEEEGLREALTSTGNGYFCARGAVEWEDARRRALPRAPTHTGRITGRRRSWVVGRCSTRIW